MVRRSKQRRDSFGEYKSFNLPIVWMTCSRRGLIAIDVHGTADFYDTNGFKIGTIKYSSQDRAVVELEKEGWEKIQQREGAEGGCENSDDEGR